MNVNINERPHTALDYLEHSNIYSLILLALVLLIASKDCFCSSVYSATIVVQCDPLNRITNAAYSDGSSESYSYDPAGNRLRYTSAVTNAVNSSSIALYGNLAFDIVTIGRTPRRTLTISSIGSSSLSVTGISYPPGFSGDWAGTIPANSSQQVLVTFTPTEAIIYPGNLSVASDAANGNGTLAVSGIGILTNIPPTPHNDTVTVPQNAVGKILVSKLIANDYSPFGDELTLDSYQSVSSNGIAISSDNTKLWLYYNSASLALAANISDYFTYTVRDTVGGLGTGVVQVKVLIPNINYVPNNIVAALQNPVDGSITMTFLGIDGRPYHVQGTTDLIHGPWSDLELYDRSVYPDLTLPGAARTNIFNCINGAIVVTDPDAASYGNRFYRSITPQ